jgi:hypothetical protein
LGICLWCWLKNEVYKRKADTRDELLAGILDAATRIKEREDQLRRKKKTFFAHEWRSGLKLAVGFFEHLL